jgi:RHS repeat-associated protein
MGNRTLYDYDRNGGLASFTDPKGHASRIRCDASGLPVEVADPFGNATMIVRDFFGRPIRIVGRDGATTVSRWSVEGKLLQRTGPDGGTDTFEWDPEGNLLAHIDSIGGRTSYTYGAFDLPISETTPDGSCYRLIRDTELNVAKVCDPAGLTWEYTYDPCGRVVAESDFDSRVMRYVRDAAGQIIERVNAAGQAVRYTRSPLGMVIRKQASDGTTTAYQYDQAGRVTAATGAGVEVSRAYDPVGNLLTETVNGRTLSLTHDACNQLTGLVTPAGHHSTWTLDAVGLPTALNSDGHLLRFARDVTGRESRRTIGEGLTLTHEWDQEGRVTAQRLVNTAGQMTDETTYSYRADHYLTGIATANDADRSFTLDPVGRVTLTRARDQVVEAYEYDAAGNQVAATWPGTRADRDGVGSRTYDGTMLTHAGTVRYEYDAAGRTTLRQKVRPSRAPETWRYSWNAEDQLVRTVTPDGTVWTYSYDPFGRRTAKRRHAEDGSIGEEITFVWHDSTVIEQTDSGGHTYSWDYHDQHPLTQTERVVGENDDDRRFYAIVTDIVGTPLQAVTPSGETVWQSDSTVWGMVDGDRTTPRFPLRFPGQYADDETGWNYNYFRHYDPTAGRYTTPDPLGLRPGPNPYLYPHNPFTWSDPLGLASHTTSSHAQILGANMEAAGTARPPHTAAHHIVASTSPKAAPARQQLSNVGIDINDARNGVFLPRSSSSPNPTGASPHSRIHTNDYYAYVNDLMSGARNASEAGDVLNHVRNQLLGGYWP